MEGQETSAEFGPSATLPNVSYEARLKYISLHDPLPDSITAYYENELQRLEGRIPGSHFGRPDGLKLINDILGHKEGDRCLRFARCKSAAQVGYHRPVGGDEFVLLMPRTDQKAGKGGADSQEIENYNRQHWIHRSACPSGWP